MAIPLFLAAHPDEPAVLPEHYAWLAWDLSEELPASLPRESMVVVTDRVIPRFQNITRLTQCASVLLDFQHPDSPQTRRVAEAIVRSCPVVGVSEPYAAKLDCPVFVSPVPPDRPLENHLAPWHGREIWLDLSPSPTRITVTAEGSRREILSSPPTPNHVHKDNGLFCHYGMEIRDERIVFELWRTREDMENLLSAAKTFGVTRAVGLYQELGIW